MRLLTYSGMPTMFGEGGGNIMQLTVCCIKVSMLLSYNVYVSKVL